MINKHLTTVAAMAMIAGEGLSSEFSREGYPATEEQRERKKAGSVGWCRGSYCQDQRQTTAKEEAEQTAGQTWRIQPMIYLVQGTTGEYDDYQEWITKAFFKKKSADAYCKKLNAIAATFVSSARYEGGNIEDRLQKLDKQARVDYTGTGYAVMPLKVSNA